MIDTILWDLDGTLMDFHLSERVALREAFADLDYAISEEHIALYSAINDACWKQYERGEITQASIVRLRFDKLFGHLGRTFDTDLLNDRYLTHLGEHYFLNENAFAICQRLHGFYRQYIVTNGHPKAQHAKIKGAGFDRLMNGVFISSEVGYQKPDPAFFDRCFEKIGEEHRAHTILVGDSLTSDMQGGNNAQLLCCWYNPTHQTNTVGVHLDAEIAALAELPAVLKKF